MITFRKTTERFLKDYLRIRAKQVSSITMIRKYSIRIFFENITYFYAQYFGRTNSNREP